MKITGTKKLLIIFCAVICVFAAGLGVIFTRAATSGTVAYAASDDHILPMAAGEKASDATSAADIEARAALAEATGLAPELISFYARSNNGTEKELYDAYLENDLMILDSILTFAEAYSLGEIESVSDISDEDWFISPDDASTYNTWTGTQIGLGDSWVNYYTSKSGGLTTESQYYRNSNFAMGYYVKWDTRRTWAYRHSRSKHNFMYYNIVWLEEGESYTFGYNLTKNIVNVFAETTSSLNFLSTSTLLTSGTHANTYSGYVRDYLFSDTKANEAANPNPIVKIDPDTSRNTYNDYLDEFGSTISPATTSYTLSGAGGGAGNKRMTIKPDAPSGAYMIVAQAGYDQSGNQFLSKAGSSTWRFRYNGDTAYGTGWENYSAYCTYATLVCRKGITKPELEFGEGVSSDLKSKTVSFNNEDHEMVINGDWGSGLMDYVISEWDNATSAWVPAAKNTSSANVKQSARGTRGSITKAGQLKFKAKNAGKYKVEIIPFRNWKVESDLTDESDRTPVVFEFTIKPQELSLPYIIDDGDGVDNTQNLKYVYRTNRTQYISIYPSPSVWTEYSVTSDRGNALSEFTWSTNGVLTLSQSEQDKYKISISLKYNTDTQTNLTWADGTTTPKVYTFEIGPMKVEVPDIIKDGVGGVTSFTKQVTYNGAYQTLSFMPVDESQLNINAINASTGEACGSDMLSIKDSTLTFTALDAGRYEMTVSVKDEFIFDDASLSLSLTYVLIIDEMPIDAPRLNEPSAVNNTKTVTYGGEKMPDGLEDWVATLSFANADQSRITWISNTLSQQTWSDSDLVLAGRSAKTYDVTFKPNKNYKWKDGVTIPTYTLVIEKLKIGDPQLVRDDGDDDAVGKEFTNTSKLIRFDGKQHPFKIYLPTLDSVKDIIYTKASSVEFQYNGTFDREWDGDYVTYRTSSAGEYTFEIFPTQNYCWSDGSTGSKIFTFIIQPVDVQALHFYATNQWDTDIQRYYWSDALGGFHAILNFNGQPKTVRIGNPDAKDDSGKYVLTGDYAKYFYLLDENGAFINRSDEGLTGTAAKLLDGMTCDEGDGFLTLTMTTAGVYRVGVILGNPNFWWTETQETMVVYTLTINPEGVEVPTIEQDKCQGNDIYGHFGVDSMHGTYYNVNFALAIKLDDSEYQDIIEVLTPDGKIFKFVKNRTDSVVIAELEEALGKNKGTYTDWYNGTMYFYAKDQGEYTWTVRVTSSNHAWAGKTERELSFTLRIDRSPVSGLEMRYVGDTDENLNVLVGNATNVRGGDTNALTVRYELSTYSEKDKEFYFVRSDTKNLVDTGFSAQFGYSVNKFVMDSEFDVNDMSDVKEVNFDDEELRLSALDAGTYEIIITPTDNYCWNDPGKTTGPVKFTLVIKKLTIDTPLVILDDGSTTASGVKDAEYDHKYLTMQLDLLDFPKGYAIKSFEYVSTDKAEREAEGDLMPVKISGKGTLHALDDINLGVDPDTVRMSVQAQSAGEYLLTVVVSNVNNYQLAAGFKLEYRFNIARRSVTLPEAYLDKVHLTEADAGKLTQTDAEVRAYVGTENAVRPDSENTLRAEFDSYFHSVYLYGDDIVLGDFEISVTGATENGMTEKKVFQPDAFIDNTTDEAGYFRLSAFGVNTYTITLKFVTRDFYWDKDISSSGQTRSYKFIITSKLIDVPTVSGYSQLTLIDNKYTVEFPYVKDVAGTVNDSHRMITLTHVEFGVVAGTTPDTTYAIINSKISSNSTANGVILTNYPKSIDDTYGTITMQTSLNGVDGGEAKVLSTYVIELNIDPNNMRWNTGAEGDTLTKYYEIKIVKQKVERPFIIDTVNSTGDEKHVTYTGADWVEALQIALIDTNLIDSVLSNNLTMTKDHKETFIAADLKEYKNVLLVSTDPEAGTYTVTARLLDPDNSEWEDGSTADVIFSLIVDKMQVSKPYIYIPDGSTEAQEGVVGWTKTVVYENDPVVIEHLMKVGNFWANSTVDPSLAAVSNVPDVMSYTVENGTLKTEAYNNTGTLDGDKFKDYFLNGLLSFGAENADKYIIKFKLSGNAVWDDGSTGDIDVTLIINKKMHTDLKIFDGETDTVTGNAEWRDDVTGNTKTYTYKLDSEGNPVVAFMQIENYDDTLMEYTGLISGTLSGSVGDGYLEDSGTGLGEINNGASYRVTAFNAGEYVIEFTLKDYANHRWEFADVATCTFTLNIKKLKLFKPVINTDYSLNNESVEGDTLTVDYDKNLHTILVQSLYGNVKNGVYSHIGDKYFTVADNTAVKNAAADPNYNPATHLTFFKAYDSMGVDLRIRDLFEDTTVFTNAILDPAYEYTGEHADELASIIDVNKNLFDLFRLTAYTPGDYYLTFKLTDSANMEWADTTATEIDYKIVINKVMHDAPSVANGTATSQEYTGDKVNFTLNNAYNGIMTDGGKVTGTVSEKYEIIGYQGNDKALSDADAAGDFTDFDFEVKWFNGVLVLGFTEVGTYKVRVSITDADFIGWNGTTDTFKEFDFTVSKCTVNANITFSAQDDPELDAKLREHQNFWYVTVKGGVDAEIVLTGLRDVPTATDWDQRLEFKVYYANITDAATELGSKTYSDTGNPFGLTKASKQPDGTYNMTIWYQEIGNGKGNIKRGKYLLYVVQVDTDGNHRLAIDPVPFEIEADPAPFKSDMLEWVYSRSTDPAGTPYTPLHNLGQTVDNPFILDYEENVAFTFIPQLKAEYQGGYNNPSPIPVTFLDQLNTYFVTWDGSYNGVRIVSAAGDNFVSIIIKAADPDEYSFPDYEFKLYYKINKAKYNLSNLEWIYDATVATEPYTYTYDGANKSVSIAAKAGTNMPTGLAPKTYRTSGTYVSLNNPGVQTTIPASNTNVMQFAGQYTTELLAFAVTDKNYETPVSTNPDSYEGSFDWTRTWTINPQHIVVDWVQGQTTGSDGTITTRSKPAVAGTHAGKFAYTYEVEDANEPSGWRQVNSITREPNTIVWYRATAYLKSGSGATDYARNYTFEFIGGNDPMAGNPLEFEVGGDDTEIFNHITVDGKIETDYEYTGNPFIAATVIDFDTSNGQITVADNIVILYYRRDPATGDPVGSPLAAAPSEIGNYIVVLKLRYSGTTEDFTLSEKTYEYNIVKAKLSVEDFEWRVKHNGVEARFDTSLGGKWIDVETDKEIIVDYDGKPYEVYLYTELATTVISFIIVDSSQINAGTYSSTAMETMDTAHYEFDSVNPPLLTFDWVIEKHYLDFKDVAWNYEEPFVFTVVNGKAKSFSARIENIPDYLSDKIEYKVYQGDVYVDGDISDSGSYTTTFKILEDKIDTANYELGSWPSAISLTLDWEIKRKAINVPVNDMSWTEFDGVQHNLLKPFGFDVDWNEYFDVDVTYADFEGNSEAYNGTANYGNKYYAYNAGTYTFGLKIKQVFNKDSSSNPINNIVWIVKDESGTRQTPNDQSVSYSVAKKELVVTGWMQNFELSYVVLAGNIDSTKFIDYKFYLGDKGEAGTEATLNDVLQSGGGDKFSMVPEIRSAYSGNITLTFEQENYKFISFVTPEITEENAQKVNGKPYVYGYTVNGVFTPFTNDQLASGDLYVTYSGDDITFKIYNWDTYYSNYVTVYGCSLDDLTQRDAGEYTLTLILRSDLEKPLYWGKTADNKIDRSAVTLTFKIRYKMLTIPELPAEVTYDGSVINILDKASNSTYAKLLAEYGDYVEISGNTAINAGEQTLYLNIKEEYGNAVRWDNGDEQGIVGTYSFAWKIIPVLIQKPDENLDVRIEYDGQAHSVFEVLKGYDDENPTPEIATLMANINETGGRGIDAGSYEAVLSLPNENYAWCDASGNVLDDRNPVKINWVIGRKVIDFGNAFWGYMDGEEEVEYDVDSPFVFTVENGKPKNFTVEILGMPEILKICTSYSTNGIDGNSAGDVGTYTTTVTFDLSKLDRKNYEVGVVPDSISELVWKVIPREIALPEFDESWTEFDGELHDLPALLGLGEDWSEYLDIYVEYKESNSDSYEKYKGEDDFVVGYSNYTGFYYGFYKLTISIRYDAVITSANVKWFGGTAPEDVVIEVTELDINVSGWFEDDENSYVTFANGQTLSEVIAGRLEYLIYEDGDPNKTPLKPEDIVGGKTYYIEYVVKNGKDENGIEYGYGIRLSFANGVPNPLEFGTGNYGDQPIIWLPAPVLKTAVLEYNGEAQTFVINDFDTVYKLTYAKRNQLNALYSLGLGDDVTSFVYLQTANALTATSAGSYTAVVRLLSKVRLSWYDSTIYSVDSNGNLVYKDGGATVIDSESLFNNKSFTLNYTIKPKKVPVLTDEDLEKLLGIIVGYDGTEKDVTQEAKEVFAELEAKYGKIFDYAGNKGTAAAEYELTITLADLGSCFWYVGEPTEKEVQYDGYAFKCVADGDGWKLVLVKVDAEGNAEIDSSGNYVEFKYGEYNVNVEYLPEFETEFVKIRQDPEHPEFDLVNADGTVKTENSYWLVDDERVELGDGTFVTFTYEMDENNPSIVVWYRYDAALDAYFPTNDPDEAEYVKRIKLDIDADVKYGYKVTKTEDVKEYTYLYNKLTVNGNGDPVAIQDKDGKFIDTYLFFNGSGYELRKYDLDASGNFVSDGANHYVFDVVEATCDIVDETTYTVSGGKFVATVGGEYMLRYVLDGTNRKQQIVYAKDKDGNLIVDTQFTVVTEFVYEEVTDKEYKIKWEISSAVLPMPEFDEALMQQYTGGTLYAKDVLKGFLPDLMEIVEGGEGVNAGEYTAKIVLTTTNSKWDPADTTEDYVLVTWRIDTAKVDFSEVKLVFTDGTNVYEDADNLVYTRKDGKPVVYWLQIANLPEALKGRVIFNTNGRPGAYAGTDAGKYETIIDFDTDSNFENFSKPEEFNHPITWHIQRRTLEIPGTGTAFMVFDSEPHDLLEMLGVSEDWNEYYDIKVQFADNFVDFKDYYGYEGNPYVTFGSGAYKFSFSIKSGINTTATNPNVVWAKNADGTEPPDDSGVPDTPDTDEDSDNSDSSEANGDADISVAAFVEFCEISEVAEELSDETEEESVAEIKCVKAESNVTAKQAVNNSVQEVCDRLKELAFGAESRIKFFRKYPSCTRGTV